MIHKNGQVEVWQEQITIPTYEVGKADKNPMFLEKRVYQGSSGKVYPCPVIDKIYDEKVDKVYQAVWLENDYLKVMVLPELGGRIQRALDKTNDYDFVYYNEVIKPALVGLAGPWISGGIEFNWPQHHRPTTYCPVDFVLQENDDGSKTVRVSEVDQMYGTKGMASFTLYPDKAYIEIKGQLYNRTAMPQTFLWWANPAVAVNDYTQSIFPPDVTAVMDHGKRDVSKFPIATGVYYKHDYGAGVDISRYKNIPVPTSYMAYHSDYNFVGGYDYEKQAGILHIANHHVSPGKKQWTWGCGDFGQAWDRNLTDENGPYIELMTGMFTDNQPDFTWLKPFEEKVFTQYFMPYKQAANVKNASTEAVLNLETEDGGAHICVYTTSLYKNATIVLKTKEETLFSVQRDLSPTLVLNEFVAFTGIDAWALTLAVYDETGRELLHYTPAKPDIEKQPQPATALPLPSELASTEQLYLAGTHLEQYRHATFLPEDYYLEGLKRDEGDLRCNNAYGLLLLRRGQFKQAQAHFEKAVARATWKNPNPYDSEPYYNLGLSLYYQGDLKKAFDAFFKATWTSAQQEMAFYYTAAIAAQFGEYGYALEYIDRALVKNSRNLKARGLKATLLRRLGQAQQASALCEETLQIDPFAYVCAIEQMMANSKDTRALVQMRNQPAAFIETAIDYAEAGDLQRAVEVLRLCSAQHPMLKYYEAYYLSKLSQFEQSQAALQAAADCSSLYCFPNKLEDITVLEFALQEGRADAKAAYYLGCLYYDKRIYGTAQQLWECSIRWDDSFATAWRNLAIVYYNKNGEPQKALQALEKAFALDSSDARVFLELDQLYKKLNYAPKQRIVNYENHTQLFMQRDDLVTEYITLLNLLGKFEQAYILTMSHKFHPWEGGEGKITAQYMISLREMAKAALQQGEVERAQQMLKRALHFPHNLGEGKLEGAKNNDLYYYLGVSAQMMGDETHAQEYFMRAAVGDEEPAGMMYYNDQPADMILYQGLAQRALGNEAAALKRFHKLVDYGEKHMFDEVKIEYFAVSLPDLQLWDEDLNVRNKAHCNYLIALGSYGLAQFARAQTACEETLKIDSAHIGAVIHRPLFAEKTVVSV